MLAVAFDRGAASAAEVAAAVGKDTPLAFLIHENAHTERVRPVLAELGTVVPLTGDDRDIDRVRALRPDGIVTFSEPMLRDTARLATALGLPGHRVDTVELLTNKTLQRERLAEAGVDSLRHHEINSREDWPAALRMVGLPAVVKPMYGGGSRDTYLIEDEQTAERLCRSLSERLVLEEFLRGRPSLPYGDYVSVESLCAPDRITHLAVAGKFPQLPPFRELGQFWPADLPPGERAAVLDLVTRTLEALGVEFGITHTEVKLTPDGPRIIEVNGRLGGLVNELSRRAAGLDLVRIGTLMALGEPAWADPVDPLRVYFQYWGSGPTGHCQLIGTTGAKELRRVKGIAAHHQFVRPGQWLHGGVMTSLIEIVCGDADDHPAMFATLDEAFSKISHEFRFDSGETVTMHPPRPWAESYSLSGEPR
jgi:carbamoylphosphate synthase large subunit